MAVKDTTPLEDPDHNPFMDPACFEVRLIQPPDEPACPPEPEPTLLNPPHWRVFSPADAVALVDEAESDSELGKGPVRYEWLARLVQDPDCGMRPLILPDAATMDAVQRLRQSAPHLERFFGVVVPSLGAALHASRPLELPPILLLGAPGVGKTHVARELAKAIGMPSLSISMPNQSTAQVFCGRDMSWKSPAIGAVARALITNGSASPLFVLDEIDKTAGRQTEYGDTLGPMHDLLEPSTACTFEDELLKVRFDASRICWLATANDLDPLPPSLVDRFLVIEVPTPSEKQMIVVLESLYADLITSWDAWFRPALPGPVAQALRHVHPRKARQTLSLALTMAAHANRHTLEVDDIASALRIRGEGAARKRMGFI
jgi:ATP-dependent Lon protease